LNQDSRRDCDNCNGCGQVANTEAGEPWSVWEALPEASKGAVRLGLVRPVRCPVCLGKGRVEMEYDV
jgi:DnaJ-class molecular chaperone